MNIEQIFRHMARNFFIVLGASLISMWLFHIKRNENAIEMHNVLTLLIQSVILTLGYFMFYSEKELSKNKMIIRLIINFIFVVTTVLIIGFIKEWYNWSMPLSIFKVILCIVIIYGLVVLSDVINSKVLANSLNRIIKEHKK